jgi:hypothetical protein
MLLTDPPQAANEAEEIKTALATTYQITNLGNEIYRNETGTISWQSRKQDIVAMSTLEAEYIACSEASRDGRWLLQLCKDVKHNRNDENDENKLLPILCDNEGSLAHIASGIIKSRTKYIDRWEDRSTRSSRKPWVYGGRH